MMRNELLSWNHGVLKWFRITGSTVVLNRRFTKHIKTGLIILLLLISFYFIQSNVSDLKLLDKGDRSSMSANDYMDYLQNYMKAYSEAGSEEEADKKGFPSGLLIEDMVVEPKMDDEKRTKLLKGFHSKVFKYISAYSPAGKSMRKYDSKCSLSGDISDRPDNYDQWYKLTKKELGNCLDISKRELKSLKSNHSKFVANLNQLVLPRNVYHGKGIVIVGGGKFSLLAFLIIKTLRNLGTTLPVEVFIPPQDEEERSGFCDTILSDYNAKCIFISDILPQEIIDKNTYGGYQFKSIALVASSFDDLLLLDADNFPIKNINGIFNQEPYKLTGLVLWPDFWRRTTNPKYYDIANIPINLKKRVRNSMDDITPPEIYTENLMDLTNVPLHDFEGTIPELSTESGQLLINKSKHLRTIILALYYNVNGPSWYYPIFSQKASGEGDKETFIAAAVNFGLPFYQVKTKTGVDGYYQQDDEGFRGVAMLQHDFAQDYKRYSMAKEDVMFKYKTSEVKSFDKNYTPDEFYKKYIIMDNGQNGGTSEVDVMFVHSNLPKFDPFTLWEGNDLIVNGKHIRSYRNLQKLHNYDLELENFKVFHQEICLDKVKFKYLEEKLEGNEENFINMCKYINDRVTFLHMTHNRAIEPK